LLKRILIGLVKSQEHTGDKAKDPKLKSHYYRLSKDRAWEEIGSILKKMQGYRVLHEVPTIGEIVMEKRTISGRTMDITVQIVGTGPGTSAVEAMCLTPSSAWYGPSGCTAIRRMEGDCARR